MLIGVAHLPSALRASGLIQVIVSFEHTIGQEKKASGTILQQSPKICRPQYGDTRFAGKNPVIYEDSGRLLSRAWPQRSRWYSRTVVPGKEGLCKGSGGTTYCTAHCRCQR
jgi:hypothetical protein